MPRVARVAIAGVAHQVTQRGVGQQFIPQGGELSGVVFFNLTLFSSEVWDDRKSKYLVESSKHRSSLVSRQVPRRHTYGLLTGRPFAGVGLASATRKTYTGDEISRRGHSVSRPLPSKVFYFGGYNGIHLLPGPDWASSLPLYRCFYCRDGRWGNFIFMARLGKLRPSLNYEVRDYSIVEMAIDCAVYGALLLVYKVI